MRMMESRAFRRQYPKLKEPVMVTRYGKRMGVYRPVDLLGREKVARFKLVEIEEFRKEGQDG